MCVCIRAGNEQRQQSLDDENIEGKFIFDEWWYVERSVQRKAFCQSVTFN